MGGAESIVRRFSVWRSWFGDSLLTYVAACVQACGPEPHSISPRASLCAHSANNRGTWFAVHFVEGENNDCGVVSCCSRVESGVTEFEQSWYNSLAASFCQHVLFPQSRYL